ncbi:MAG: ribonuclease J [Firmicutes bacterium]|nr:ribonuclease J [Bacillota bacterium]
MKPKTKAPSLKVIFLGGVGEIGKNMTALEFGNDIVVIDCGATFPTADMPGVDLVIPDPKYLIENKDRVRGIVLTHGHEDHVGALPFVLKELKVPVYGTRLALAIVENKLKEAKVTADLKTVKAGSTIQLGKNFKAEFISVSHSIVGSCAISISTPLGTVFHTGDFKVDFTPEGSNYIDLNRIAKIGQEEVLLLMAESTNVERAGYTMSEATVKNGFNTLFNDNADSRIIIATFASNVNRMKQIIDIAIKYRRKIVFCGRSMINIADVATKIGELEYPKSMEVDINSVHKYEDKEICIITTGSQGEPMSALTRMANGEFSKIKLGPNDTIILSSSPIPGNERSIYNVINNVYRLGAKVVYESLADVHVSGHACREELKLIHTLLKPKFFIPVHGEYRHQKRHADLAVSMGVPARNILITDIGDVVEVTDKEIKMRDKVSAGSLLVDGLGVGDVGSAVLNDRRHLAEEGIFVVVLGICFDSGQVKSIDIATRGFAFMTQNDTLIDDTKELIKAKLASIDLKLRDWQGVRGALKRDLKNYLFKRIKRTPMILTMIVDCDNNVDY